MESVSIPFFRMQQIAKLQSHFADETDFATSKIVHEVYITNLLSNHEENMCILFPYSSFDSYK